VERLALDNNVTLPQLGIQPPSIFQEPRDFLNKKNGGGENRDDEINEDSDDEFNVEGDGDEMNEEGDDDEINVGDDYGIDDEEDDDEMNNEDISDAQGGTRPFTRGLLTSQTLRAIAPPSPAASKTKGKKATTLTKLTVSIADSVSIEEMRLRRDQFRLWMRKADAKSLQQNRALPIEFTRENTIAIPNFFFDQVMGVGGISHLASLISYYSHHPLHEADRGVGMRADELSLDLERPQIIREFFGKIARQQSLIPRNMTLYKMLFQNIVNIDVLNHLNQMKIMARNRDPELARYLEKIQETPNVGKGLTSCLINHLMKSLELDKNAFDSLTQSAQGPHALVMEFGAGILCLLPKGATGT
jgi:hypothetical protein